ncbi:MAG: short-chain dehydrogenase/reductase SDR [Xanthobacteraceae bacterium]|nr:MAG: short-chain dehydrogenase/reductase SDR [Xanthobacteraceae bacterium]
MIEPGTALVTGGARRIGRAIVEALADAGYAVAIHAHRSGTEAEALAAAIAGRGGRATVVSADLAEPAEVDALVAASARALGAPLTLLVNNASEFVEDHLGSLTREVWNRQFRVNIQTPSMLAQDFAAQAPAGSSIVNITDQRVFKPTPHFYSYALTKVALTAATVAMAQALAPRIRVNAVAPGPSLQGVRQGLEDFARQQAATLTGGGSPPSAIAEAVLYLARATAVTGVTLPVDGGQHLMWQTPDVVGVSE